MSYLKHDCHMCLKKKKLVTCVLISILKLMDKIILLLKAHILFIF